MAKSGKMTVKMGPMVIVSRANGVGRTVINAPVCYEGLDNDHVEEMYDQMATPEFQAAWAQVIQAWNESMVPFLRAWGVERDAKE